MRLRGAFDRFATRAGQAFGSPWAFVLCVAGIGLWLAWGPVAQFGPVWQLWVNTISTLITTIFCVVIQHTQEKTDRALHLKLDELLRAVAEARTGLVDLQSWPEEDLERLQDQFRRLRADRGASCEAPARKSTGATRPPPPGQGEDDAGR